MKVIGILPLRIGSKSIKEKNIINICGNPLCFWILNAMNSAKYIDEIYVASDSEKINKTIIDFSFNKVKIIERSPENSMDHSSSEDVLLEVLDKIDCDKNDIVFLAQATNPFVTNIDFERAYEKYKINKFKGSILSVSKTERFFWSNKMPINYDVYDRKRRQDFISDIFVENGGFYLNTVSNIYKSKNRLTSPYEFYIMDASSQHELDEPSDIAVIESLLKTQVAKKINFQKIKVIISDVDGVLTSGEMYYTEKGDELKKFHTYDGVAFSMFKKKGIKTGIITSENSKSAYNRAKKLELDYIYIGKNRSSKKEAIEEICYKENILPENVLYVGDDLNCIDALEYVGLKFCPSNARKEVKVINNIIRLSKQGGEGVIREIYDLIYD